MANFGIISIRKELACKQVHMAEFLNIPRQLLAHVEKDARELEMAQLEVLANLHNLLDERKKSGWNSPDVAKLIAKEKSSADDKLAESLSETRHLWQKHRIQLDKMQAEYHDRIQALHQLYFLKSRDGLWSKKQLAWIDHSIELHKSKLTLCGIEAQRELDFQIGMLASKIETLNKCIGNKFDILLETLNVLDGLQSQPIGTNDQKK
jgi:DNA-binding XRE family transcriptional regulator